MQVRGVYWYAHRAPANSVVTMLRTCHGYTLIVCLILNMKSQAAAVYPQRQLELGVSWPTPNTKFWEQPARVAPMPVDVGAGSNSVEPRDSRMLDVVHLTAELAPIAKVCV